MSFSSLNTPSGATGLSPHDEDEWLRLRNVVARERGFWFGALFAESGLGLPEIWTRTASFLRAGGRRQEIIEATTPEDLGAAVDRVLESDDLDVGLWWIVARHPFDIGATAEAWQRGWRDAIVALNRRRDTLRRDHRHGLVLVGPPDLLRLLATDAVDLWSIRTFVADLLGAPVFWEGRADPSQPKYTPTRGRSRDLRADLAERLARDRRTARRRAG